MTTIPKMMRAGPLAVVLAAGTLVGCGVSDQAMTAQGTRLIGSSGVAMGAANTGPYSGADYAAALDSVMTTDSSGD